MLLISSNLQREINLCMFMGSDFKFLPYIRGKNFCITTTHALKINKLCVTYNKNTVDLLRDVAGYVNCTLEPFSDH